MRVSGIKSPSKIVWGGHSCPPTAESKNTQAGNFGSSFVLTLCVFLTTLAPQATAQRAAPAHAASPHSAIPRFNLPNGSFAFGRGAYPSRFRSPFPYTSLPFPFFGDSLNLDDIYSTGYPVASQPPVILLQAAHALAGPADYADHEASIPQPLMIELQNGHYVRVNSAPADGEALPLEPVRANSCAPSRAQRGACVERALLPADAAAAASPPHDLPPVLLVFRDGHSEEVRDYTIADGILYARGDYYTDGYWNKKIDLSTLSLSQTLEANATRQVKFVLPSSPNEVITRP
jgi:hypothetical protein